MTQLRLGQEPALDSKSSFEDYRQFPKSGYSRGSPKISQWKPKGEFTTVRDMFGIGEFQKYLFYPYANLTN